MTRPQLAAVIRELIAWIEGKSDGDVRTALVLIARENDALLAAETKARAALVQMTAEAQKTETFVEKIEEKVGLRPRVKVTKDPVKGTIFTPNFDEPKLAKAPVTTVEAAPELKKK